MQFQSKNSTKIFIKTDYFLTILKISINTDNKIKDKLQSLRDVFS